MKITLEQKTKINNSLKNMYKLQKECKRNGHPGETVLSTDSSGTSWCICDSCGEMYYRRMASEEHTEFNRKMQEPYIFNSIN